MSYKDDSAQQGMWFKSGGVHGTRCIRRTSNRTSSHSTVVPSRWKKGRATFSRDNGTLVSPVPASVGRKRARGRWHTLVCQF